VESGSAGIRGLGGLTVLGCIGDVFVRVPGASKIAWIAGLRASAPWSSIALLTLLVLGPPVLLATSRADRLGRPPG
jgi:hypothetical protein